MGPSQLRPGIPRGIPRVRSPRPSAATWPVIRVGAMASVPPSYGPVSIGLVWLPAAKRRKSSAPFAAEGPVPLP